MSKNQNSVVYEILPLTKASACINLSELFSLIDSSLKKAPENVQRTAVWLRDSAVRSDRNWQHKTIGYLTACWAFGALDLATLRHFEKLIQNHL